MSHARLDRVLDPAFVDGLEDLPTADLRERRAEAEAEEEAISYVRRLLQGRLDLLRAELRRRQQAGSDVAVDLLGRLSEVLTDQSSGERDVLAARATRLRVPPGIEPHEARLDEVLSRSDLDDLGAVRDETLEEYVDRLAALEGDLSEQRRTLFGRIDALRSELAARYKDGRAAVSDLISGE